MSGQETFGGPVRLVGADVEVRPFTLDDAADYIDVIRAGEDWLPPNFPTEPKAEPLAWWLTEGVHQPHRFGVGVHLVVAERESGRLAGTIGLFRVDWTQLTCEVGYGMRPAARGRGYASQALRLVARWALGDCGLHRIELRALTTNAASVRVAEKSGFRLEGVARGAERVAGRNVDQYVFGLIKPDLDARLDSVAIGGSAPVPAAASPGSTPMTHDITASVAAIAAAGERTLVLHTGDLTGDLARRMLPALPDVCFTDPGGRADDAVRAAAAHGLAQLIVVGTIDALADGVPLAEVTADMGGLPEPAAAVAGSSPARVYGLWEDAGLLGQCGRELCRRVALRLEEIVDGSVAAQVVMVDSGGTRMVGMYGRMARTG
ncbi:GNAT family N-acetyltransferase [Actinomadura kijaniata]|uniref:GNAT family N-acetyltransferase n=1 Tax=Actinomadura kijaniata TaxID=46161 RepID=UPI003F1C444D